MLKVANDGENYMVVLETLVPLRFAYGAPDMTFIFQSTSATFLQRSAHVASQVLTWSNVTAVSDDKHGTKLQLQHR